MSDEREKNCGTLEHNPCGPLSGVVLLAFAVMALLIAYVSAHFLYRNTDPKYYLALYYGLPCLFLFGAAALLPNRPHAPMFGMALFLAALLLKGAMAALFQTQPESDFSLFYAAAQQLAQGNNLLNETPYFQCWAYQSGFVAWMALWIKFFGADVAFFKGMNVLLSALTHLLIYLFARRFASERGARVAALAFLFYPGTFFLIPLLTNQHLSEFLLLAALWVCTLPAASARRRALQSAAGGLLLALSNFIRPTAAVVLLAAAGYGLIQFVESTRGERRKAGGMLFFLLSYGLVWAALSGAVQITGLNQNGLTSQAPEWKFILGLNEATAGQYNSADEAAVFGPNGPRQEVLRALLRERISLPPNRMFALFWRKIEQMWGSFEDTFWLFTRGFWDELNTSGIGTAVLYWMDKLRRLSCGYYMVAGVLAGVGAFSQLKRRSLPESAALAMLTALAYFCAHLFIEIQVRYRSTMTLFLMLLTAPGADVIASVFRPRKGALHRRL